MKNNLKEEIEMLVIRMEKQKSLFEITSKRADNDAMVKLFLHGRIEENDYWRKELEKIISQ